MTPRWCRPPTAFAMPAATRRKFSSSHGVPSRVESRWPIRPSGEHALDSGSSLRMSASLAPRQLPAALPVSLALPQFPVPADRYVPLQLLMGTCWPSQFMGCAAPPLWFGLYPAVSTALMECSRGKVMLESWVGPERVPVEVRRPEAVPSLPSRYREPVPLAFYRGRGG